MKYTYKNGLPFGDDLANTLDSLILRVKNGKASLMILDGQQGEGKTTLLVHCIDYINKKMGLPEASLTIRDHPQLAMGGEQFVKGLRECKKLKLPVLGYDEAGDFNKRGAMGRMNATLINVFQKFRGFRIIIILALPNFNVLDNYLFDCGIPRGLIHLQKRGAKYGNYSVYSLSQLNWIRYWFDKLSKGIKNMAYGKALPNYMGQFLNLPPLREKQLDIVSTKEKEKALLQEEVKMSGLLTYKDLASKLGRSVIWVKKKVQENKIKQDRVVANAKYFNEGVLNILTDFIEPKR